MSPSPTGRLVGADLVFLRTIAAPVSEVWSALSESDRLDAWIGRFEGDPASGEVDFFMTAEGEGLAAKVRINACDPPRLVDVTQAVGDEGWHLRAQLSDDAGATRLVFTHVDVAPGVAEMIGPGWDYYLDRLVAAVTGGDVNAVDWDADYYPAMGAYYREL